MLLPETAAKENPELPIVFRAAKLPLYHPVPVAMVDPNEAKEVPKKEIGEEDILLFYTFP